MNDTHSNEHAEQSIKKIGLNMRLRKTPSYKLVGVKGPAGGTCQVTKEQAEELCKQEGYSIIKPSKKLEPTKPEETGGDTVTANTIRVIRSNKDMDAFIEKYKIEVELAENATLADKKNAVIKALELEE